MFSKKEDKYLEELAKKGYLNTPKEEIQSSLDKKGYWHEYDEWRISTETNSKYLKNHLKMKCGFVFL